MTKTTMLVISLFMSTLILTGFRDAATAIAPQLPLSIVKAMPNRQVMLADVTVSGPWSLNMCDQGVWNTTVTGASGPFTYEWYVTVPGNGTEPPVTTYAGDYSSFTTYLDYWISFPDRSSINLTVDVYNSSGYVGSGYRAVYAYPCQ